jgi:transcriptional regulator with XRE-family HTH domain
MPENERSTYEEMLLEDPQGLRQEELIIEVTEALARALRDTGITQTELAAKLGKSKGFVSQILGGGRNLTLRTLADVAGALDCEVRLDLEPQRHCEVVYIHNWNQRHAPSGEALASSFLLPTTEWDDLEALAG